MAGSGCGWCLKGDKDHGWKLERVKKGKIMIVQSFIVYRMRTVATLSFVTRRDNCLEPADRSAPSHVTRHVSRDTAALSHRSHACRVSAELRIYSLNVQCFHKR